MESICLKMRLAVYLGRGLSRSDDRVKRMVAGLQSCCHEVYFCESKVGLEEYTDVLLSVGGDGTFLSASALVAESGVPVLGVNLGRMGFLSENTPDAVVTALEKGKYLVEDRTILKVEAAFPFGYWPYAVNEVVVHRGAGSILGVDVAVNGVELPTYWADGLLVATSSGSTAYSLSVGGPIVLPDARVLIVAPIAPHNLNVRPLVVPDSSEIVLKFRSRDGYVVFSADNRMVHLSSDETVCVAKAGFPLKRMKLNHSNFISALTEKLYWGEDIRNSMNSKNNSDAE